MKKSVLYSVETVNGTICELLRPLRRASGLTQEKLLQELARDNHDAMKRDGVQIKDYIEPSRTYISDCENGKTEIPFALFMVWTRICDKNIILRLRAAGWSDAQICSYESNEWSEELQNRLKRDLRITGEEIEMLKKGLYLWRVFTMK